MTPARRELEAAIAILVAPDTDPASAVIHLSRAGAGDVAGDRAALLDRARALAAAQPSAPADRRRWLVRAGAVAIAVAVAGLLLATAEPPPHPWRARYYAGVDFAEQVAEAADEDIYHRWRKRPPARGVPRDRFAIRWDSCLHGAARALLVNLAADDRARIAIDGVWIADTGADGGTRTSEPIALAAGPHHLRVDYRDRGGNAHIYLTASIDGGRFGPLPPHRLRYPGADPADPCGVGRSTLPAADPPDEEGPP